MWRTQVQWAAAMTGRRQMWVKVDNKEADGTAALGIPTIG